MRSLLLFSLILPGCKCECCALKYLLINRVQHDHLLQATYSVNLGMVAVIKISFSVQKLNYFFGGYIFYTLSFFTPITKQGNSCSPIHCFCQQQSVFLSLPQLM